MSNIINFERITYARILSPAFFLRECLNLLKAFIAFFFKPQVLFADQLSQCYYQKRNALSVNDMKSQTLTIQPCYRKKSNSKAQKL
jgi:hypothetical protein